MYSDTNRLINNRKIIKLVCALNQNFVVDLMLKTKKSVYFSGACFSLTDVLKKMCVHENAVNYKTLMFSVHYFYFFQHKVVCALKAQLFNAIF